MDNFNIRNIKDIMKEIKLKNIFTIQIILDILLIVTFILLFIIGCCILNISLDSDIILLFLMLAIFFQFIIISLKFLLFEIYLYRMIVVKNKNIIIEDKIRLPMYESIYFIFLMVEKDLYGIVLKIMENNIWAIEVSRVIVICNIIVVLYVALLNFYYYSKNKLLYFIFMPIALFNSFFYLGIWITYLIPFLSLTMMVITLRLYIIRNTCEIEFDYKHTYFRFETQR